ncbi:MAG: metallophosphatase [Chitinophagales bacterium]|nr:metallophosphatase [Chitinophagales bacterium]
MNKGRRKFIKTVGFGTAMVSVGMTPFHLNAKMKDRHLVILHTNDVHSHLDPFPASHKAYPGMGGVYARKKLIASIRNEGHPTLLFDCGDIFQGTPYFNLFNGEPEIKAMNDMGYDAGTIGNHEFDDGLENMKIQFAKAEFPIICSNYDFSNTVLKGMIEPYKIFTLDNCLKVGVFGLGVEMDGLVLPELCKGVIFQDPIETANKMADFLKNEKKCNLVVVLSHIGYKYSDSNIVCDITLAEKTNHIDVILGGHTHTFMDQPDIRKNLSNQNVIINQVGWAGVKLGRVNVKFSGKIKNISAKCHTVITNKIQNEI